MKVFSAGLKSVRKTEGMTQAGLARLVGVSVDTVRRWEAGSREPRATELQALAEVFGRERISTALLSE
jgi:transcriptional regulator with XRE-family HTH domain